MRDVTIGEVLDKLGDLYLVLTSDKKDGFFRSQAFCHLDDAEEFARAARELFPVVAAEVVHVVPGAPTQVAPAPYKLEDALQAVCAAMLFAEDVGIDALATMHVCQIANERMAEPATLHPSSGATVTVSRMAAHLLATAYDQMPLRSVPKADADGGTSYDLRTT